MLLGGGVLGVLLVTQMFLTGIGIVLLATTGLVDLRRWTYPVAALVIYTLAELAIFYFIILAPGFFASDVSLFESWGAHLLIQGQNPMAESMLGAQESWHIAEGSANITATTTGGVVSSYSYPGGTLWTSALEQAILPGYRLGVGPIVASIGFVSWLVYRVDVGLVPLALLAWFAPIIRPTSAAMGMITPLWLFPLALGLAAWYDGRLDITGLGLGLAIASKQLAWPIAGLVLIHVARTRDWRSAGRLAAIAGGVAFALVGPFIIWNPEAWASSAFLSMLPRADPLVAQGVGLTSLTVGEIFEMPRILHRIGVLAVAASLIGATWRWPERMQWVIPFASILVMLVHYRTLPSYYAAAVPLAVVALDARLRCSVDSTAVRPHRGGTA
jgi:uncharacterized membrane protein